MSRHFFLIDPLEKLTPLKDSSLLLAATLKEKGHECWLLFENDLTYQNTGLPFLQVWDFDYQFSLGSKLLESFGPSEGRKLYLSPGDTLHMRLDPPIDSRYMRALWLLDSLEKQGISILNRAAGIAQFNEKLLAYQDSSSLDSFVGQNKESLENFLEKVEAEFFVVKPLDLFQGIGIEKTSRAQIFDVFERKVDEFDGAVIVQPFTEKIHQGEVRALYFKGKELGSILKIPAKDNFLANVARGATYTPYQLNSKEKSLCQAISMELMGHGIYWLAFDILDGHLSEVNLTCPGLLVEVSKAWEKNLAEEICELLL